MSVTRLTYKLGDADLILETGKIGKQANGCVYAQWGGAAVIATICASSSVTEGQDFVPVTVEYNEKFYAAGKIPGGFVKREGRPKDKEILVSINKAIDSSLQLRSKKQLIDTFIAGINDVDDIMIEWHEFVAEQKEKELAQIISQEGLKDAETRKFVDYSFRDGNMKTTGTDIDKIMPAMSRFGGGNREIKKKNIIERLLAFFEKFFGII